MLGIKTQGKKAVGISTNKGEFSGDIVISTAPFRDMVLSLEELDCSVKELAGRLKFRNTILVYVEVKNSALGEQCGSVAPFVKGTNAKFANLPQKAQSSHSPTAIPRILEEEKQAWHKNADTLESTSSDKTAAQKSSLRESKANEAIHTKTQKTDSSMDSKETSANAERYPLFCRATASAVSRNDRNLDSSFCAQNAQSLNKSQAEGFCDDFLKKPAAAAPCTAVAGFGGFQGGGEGIYLSGNEQAPAAESAKSAQKPTLFKDNWIYVHSKDTQTGRITNFANWTKDLQCGQDSAILCLEYWANDDEPLWNLDDKALSEMAKRDLLESKLVADSSLIKNTSVLKIHKSYPVYEKGYKDNLHKIYKALDSFKDLYFIGRNGSFKYNNQDHSILMGLMCADKILGRECDLWHINTDYDYQESGKA